MYLLVISASSTLRTLVVTNLLVRGHLAAGFASLSEGESLIEFATPRCVIVCETPTLTEEAVRAVRAHPALTDKPLVVISNERPSRDWMTQWNVNRYLKIPFSIPELLQTLSTWFQSQKNRQPQTHESLEYHNLDIDARGEPS